MLDQIQGEQLADALAGPVQRVELEFAGEEFTWHVWRDGRRVFSFTSAGADELAAALAATQFVAHMALGCAPALPLATPSLN